MKETKNIRTNQIDPTIKNFIASKDLWVLRSRKNDAPLYVSYTEEGLKFATDHVSGKLIYFKNAKLSRQYDFQGNPKSVSILGDTTINPDVYVEKFVPRNHTDLRSQRAEYSVVDRAYRLLYTSYYNSLLA